MPLPAALQGNFYWYEFGPVTGAELSGRRPALIISNDDFNSSGEYGVAIAIPTSTTMPAEVHRRQHVYIAASDSWASAWQMKTIVKDNLEDCIGPAGPDEMDDVFGEILWRLDHRHAPGEIQTAEGPLKISAGTLWDLTIEEPGRGGFQTAVLAIDYNGGNKMAIAVDVTPGEPGPQSPTSVPVTVVDTERIATAHVHKVRSIDASERSLTPAGKVRSVDVVIDKLKRLL